MTRLISLADVRIAEKRQRTFRSEEDHQELFISISEGEAGLIHAPVLWHDGEAFWLVAGEGRIKVIREMEELGIPLRYEGEVVPEGMIPYTRVGELSAVGRFEAEFDENARRTPLTVAERASATAQLYELKKMKAERDGTPSPTVADLSVELRGSAIGDYQEKTRRELIVAQHLSNPEVANAKSVGEAFNIIKKGETQRRARAIAAEMGTEVRAHGVSVVHGEAAEVLRAIAAAKFDVVLCDPPYGMAADTFGEYNNSDDHAYDDSLEAWQKLWKETLPELNRVVKQDAHMYLFCDFDRFHQLRAMIEWEKAGWRVHRTPIIWKNPTGFRTPWPEHGPQRKYELILYAYRGMKKTLKVFPDVVEYPRDKNSVHSAQKPVALLRDLLSRSAMPTDEVLDFCAGSGSTGIACLAANLACVCIEKDATHYGNAVNRIQQAIQGASK